MTIEGQPDSWRQYLETGVIPDFPEKGKYRTWDKAWNPTGFTDDPQYPGQQTCRFPLDWSPAMCFMASARERTVG